MPDEDRDAPPSTRAERAAAALMDRDAARFALKGEQVATRARVASGGEGGVCPDPSAPDATRMLYERAYRAMWVVAAEPWRFDATEVQNTVSVFNAARLAYGIGKAAPADESSALDFGALMGRRKPKL